MQCFALQYNTLYCSPQYYAPPYYTKLFCTVRYRMARTALAEKGMTAEQYDKLTEMQRIKPKDDEEAKVCFETTLLSKCI